jgi:hypothetical protein
MRAHDITGTNAAGDEWIDPTAVENEFGIPRSTQAIWRSANRYGFRDLARLRGSRIVYRRSAIERWLEARSLDSQ